MPRCRPSTGGNADGDLLPGDRRGRDPVVDRGDAALRCRLGSRLRCPGGGRQHSTGGIGDTVSLILAPLLASVGVPVAMMAGRGLGHSQGTLDELDAIPGWSSNRDRRQTLDLIESCGAAIIAQTDEVAPADRTLSRPA